jgi:hypothetical protein
VDESTTGGIFTAKRTADQLTKVSQWSLVVMFGLAVVLLTAVIAMVLIRASLLVWPDLVSGHARFGSERDRQGDFGSFVLWS